jgi:RHS repeat-associated protein
VDDRIEAIIEEGRGELRFEHDARGYLVSTTYPDDRVDVRAPDEVGNLFRTAARDDREFGPTGELKKERTPDGTRTYRYDPEGNLVRREEPDGGVWTYAWDGAGRLRRVITAGGEEVALAYDPLGRRVSKTVGGRTTAWVWDGDVVLHELSTGGEAAADGGTPQLVTWIFEPDRFAPAARLGAEGIHSVVTDHLGTPLCLLDEHGAVAWQGSIDAWGRMSVAGDATLCLWRFPGQYEDAETGLYCNRFRYYEPGQGAYISQDPIGLIGGSKLHGYVEDPLTWIDTSGLSRRSDYGVEPHSPVIFRDPFEIQFSHPVRRSSRFSNPAHGTVSDLAVALRAEPSLASRISPVEILTHRGKTYSANNRRLLAFREAQVDHTHGPCVE